MPPTRLSRRDRLRQRADRAARRDAEHLAQFATRLSVATSHADVVLAAGELARSQLGTCTTTLWIVDPTTPAQWRQWSADSTRMRQVAADGRYPIDDAMRSGRPVVLPDPTAIAAGYPDVADLVASAGVRAAATLPAIDEHGRPIGAMGFGWAGPCRLAAHELALLGTITRLCGEVARRVDLTLLAQHDAALAVERARRRERFADELITVSSREEFFAALARAAPLLGVDDALATTSDIAEGLHWDAADPTHVAGVTVPLRTADDDADAVRVELRWVTPRSRPEAEEVVATLLAVARPALLRAELVAQAEERRRVSDLRAAFGARLATAVTAEHTAEVIGDFARAMFGADGSLVTRTDEDSDALVVTAAAGLGADTLGRRYVTPQEGGPSYEAIRVAALVVVPDRAALVARYPTRRDLVGDPRIGAMVAFPLVAGDRPIGAVRLHYHEEGPPLELLHEGAERFAEQAAQALERAYLADRQRTALDQANRLRDAVAALAAATDEAAVEAAVLEHGVSALGCTDAGLVAYVDESATVAPGTPRYFTGREQLHGLPTSAGGPRVGAIAVLPLTAGQQHVGELTLGWRDVSAFSGAERYALESYAEYVAQALLRARTAAREHEVVTALQQQLLPQVVPEVLGARVTTRYRPATRGLDIGGDWYDVIPLSATRTAFVVGDVVGKGPSAAASMGQLRTAVRAKASDAGPGALLVALDQIIEQHLGPEFMATVGYCVFDTLDRSITYASAGHCPGLLLGADGTTRWLAANGPPVGTASGRERESVRVAVDERCRFVLFTDGLVERRGESIDQGLDRLRDAVARAHVLTVDQCADDILAELAPRGTQADDIALVVADLAPAPPPLDETVCARPEQVAGVRGRLRDWLRHSFVDDGVADDIVIAANEAVANAIEHGSPGASAPIRVRATRADGTVRVEVVDTGSLVAHHDDPHRGRGLAMMRALMDEVEFSPSLVGTTVCLERRLH